MSKIAEVTRSRMVYKSKNGYCLRSTLYEPEMNVTHVLKEPLPNDEEDHRHTYADGSVNGYVYNVEHHYEIKYEWYNKDTQAIEFELPVLITTTFDSLNRVLIIITKQTGNMPIQIISDEGYYRRTYTPEEAGETYKEGSDEKITEIRYAIGFFDNSAPTIDCKIVIDEGQYHRVYDENFEYETEKDIPTNLNMYKKVILTVGDYKMHPTYRNHYFNMETTV